MVTQTKAPSKGVPIQWGVGTTAVGFNGDRIPVSLASQIVPGLRTGSELPVLDAKASRRCV